MPVHQVERKLAAIFAADIDGYSRLMARDEGGTLTRLRAHRAISEAITAVEAIGSGPFNARPTSSGNPTAQGRRLLASLVRQAYIDAFWLTAWASLAGILLVLFQRRPPPNPLTPPRVRSGGKLGAISCNGRRSSTEHCGARFWQAVLTPSRIRPESAAARPLPICRSWSERSRVQIAALGELSWR